MGLLVKTMNARCARLKFTVSRSPTVVVLLTCLRLIDYRNRSSFAHGGGIFFSENTPPAGKLRKRGGDTFLVAQRRPGGSLPRGDLPELVVSPTHIGTDRRHRVTNPQRPSFTSEYSIRRGKRAAPEGA